MLEHLLAVGGVDDLGVELDPEDAPFRVLEGGDGHIRGRGRHAEALGGDGDRVEVAHPHLLVGGLGRAEEQAVALDVEVRAAVLAAAGVGHLATELQGHQLGAVADAQDGDAEVIDAGIEAGRALDVDRLGPAAEDQPGRRPFRDLGRGDRVGDDLAVDVGFPDPAGDELGVLRAEVDDEDVVLGGLGARRAVRRGG